MIEEKEFDKKTSIHTLESDLASAVRDENYGKSIIKIVTDPNKKTNLSEYSASNSGGSNLKDIFTKRNVIILFIIIFIFASAGTILYILNKANNLPVEVIEDEAVIVSTSTQNPILLNNDILNSEIIQYSDFSKLNRSEIIDEINKIKEILINKKIEPTNKISINTNLTSVQFFEKIRYSGGDSLLRSFGKEYSFGLYSVKNNKFETYLLISIENFDLSFRSILEWEKYIPVDLKDIFIGNNEIISNETQATTSSTTEIQVSYTKENTVGFVDKILKNYDIREYVNNENNTDIIYGFINNKYLLITSGESSFMDIKDRLIKDNIVR